MEPPTIAVLYGTETYNLYEYLLLLKTALETRYPVVFSLMDLLDFKQLLKVRIVFFILLTFGNGDNPRNTRKFWRFLLQKRLPSNFLDHLQFSTFGLGDSLYPRYNFFIRKLHARLLQLGAREIGQRGEGDEQSPEGPEAFFKEWQDAIVGQVIAKYPAEEKPIAHVPKLPVVVETRKLKRKTDHQVQDILNLRKELLKATVLENKRMTAQDHFQDVRLFKFKSSQDIEYLPGDIVELYPHNAAVDVEYLIKSQGWEDIADCYISVPESEISLEGGYVSPLTLRSLITHHLDILSVPRRSFFRAAYRFALDERERTKLEEFSKLEFSEDLYNYANRPRRLILETVTDFFSLKIPPEYILDVFPVLRPRLFSIASSCTQANEVALCIAVVQYKTVLHKIRKGVCTSWLKDLKVGSEFSFSIKKNDVYKRIPENRPLVLVGPGTGIAPIRAIAEENLSRNKNIEMLLFLGNRSKDKDYLFGEEFEEWASKGDLLTMYPSFSRDPGGFKYVQDALYHHKSAVFNALVKLGGSLYLCGSSGKMPVQTRLTIAKILEDGGEDPERYLKQMETQGRYLQETW